MMSTVGHPTTATSVRIIASRELRDLWLRGRGLVLLAAYTLLLSVTSYVTASNRELNFLEQREALGLMLQIAIAVGALLVLVAAADAISGERDRGSLEPLLTTPAPRGAIVAGKAVAAMSIWLAAYVCAVPYVTYLARGTGVTMAALLGGLVVGTTLSVFSAALGLVISALTSTSRTSLAISLFLLLALYAPTQLPTSSQQAWFGTLLLHVDPYASGLRYLGKLVVNAHGVTDDIGWFIGPVIAAVVLVGLVVVVGNRLTLEGGWR